MVKIHETSPVREILERASNMTVSNKIAPGFSCTVVETYSGEDNKIAKFEGTILYFPGVQAHDLLEGRL